MKAGLSLVGLLCSISFANSQVGGKIKGREELTPQEVRRLQASPLFKILDSEFLKRHPHLTLEESLERIAWIELIDLTRTIERNQWIPPFDKASLQRIKPDVEGMKDLACLQKAGRVYGLPQLTREAKALRWAIQRVPLTFALSSLEPEPDDSPKYRRMMDGFALAKPFGLAVGTYERLHMGSMFVRRCEWADRVAVQIYKLGAVGKDCRNISYRPALEQAGSAEGKDAETRANEEVRFCKILPLSTIEKNLEFGLRAYSTELIMLGYEPEKLRLELDLAVKQLKRVRTAEAGNAYTPFHDVPTTHWASRAVSDLRAIGVFRGYDAADGKGGNRFELDAK